MNIAMPSTKKTIKFNPLDDISRQEIKPIKTSEHASKSAGDKLDNEHPGHSTDGDIKQRVFYQLAGNGLKGNSELIFNGKQYGFELPQSGFIPINGKDLKMQLKHPFQMPQAISGFVIGGPIGFLFSFILGEPKPKKYFFSLKGVQDNVIFISLDRLAVNSIMQIS